MIVKILRDIPSLIIEKDSLEEILYKVERSSVDLAVIGNIILTMKNSNLMTILSTVKRLEQEINLKVYYETEIEGIKKFQGGDISGLIALRRISKKEVVDFASRGCLFPAKTTRHIIPARPIGINIPLDLLRDIHLSTEEINISLVDDLKEREIKVLPAGSTVNGRTYEEKLFLFK